MPNTALLIKNPLAATHEFKQACQLCYPKTGNITPSCSTPLPRDARSPRSVEPQNDRILVHQSEMRVGNRGTSRDFKPTYGSWGLSKPLERLEDRDEGAAGTAGQCHSRPAARKLVPGRGRQSPAGCYKNTSARGNAACTSPHALPHLATLPRTQVTKNSGKCSSTSPSPQIQGRR